MKDVAIVGGGIMGLLVARELTAAGRTVTLIERGRCAGEASWAGGGIVSPLYPWRYNAAVTALASWAQDYYPELSAALLNETGIDSELEACGLLMLEADDSAEALEWSGRSGRRMVPVDAGFIHERQPALARSFISGLWMPDVANIRNPRLGQALRTSLMDSGADIREFSEVCDLALAGRQLDGLWVRSSSGEEERVQAGEYVFCTGAWTARLLERTGLTLPIEPVKGQMLLYELPGRVLDEMVLYQGRYLIPRRDRHLLAGSTLEQAGFDKSTTDEALQSLRASAEQLLPALASVPVKRQWAGLRPGAPDGVPFIGRLPGSANAWVNAGHYRNGLVLAPASARLTADLMTGRAPVVSPAPYDPAVRCVRP
ncbi:MAG: glycine oxidase ThiO [Pseudohongiellaceae bacterium]